MMKSHQNFRHLCHLQQDFAFKNVAFRNQARKTSREQVSHVNVINRIGQDTKIHEIKHKWKC